MSRFRFTCRWENSTETFEETVEASNEDAAQAILFDKSTADHFEIVSTEEITKPNIDAVFAAFSAFQSESVRIATSVNVMHRARAFEEAREALKARLTHIGLAEHIDWTERV